ncbi:uncharacterized protein L969DRAFT_46510 [Mixia osmundae IAM 14324]|uniref:DUF427 domain-containing protein n=1 Tax=Mixia osmundae (strain CBS 9802 / IAM 14324 / JCM 22182 / KY 12970) TaxID=764103 RepID=G7E6E2_MIXOS|nr:uncharacterized protein L969DRAFT_46510 [Mixia osmundae IAM 14324]KEI40441.1 hypothetical protein L969DRAFT_46510 [Mixia osmundae IAM 14324]GAA98402.1 hypothetical protein E5Q_05088 [Mixia osmundae IAM 14324]
MPSARASSNGTVIAESHDTIIVEGNHYFPPESVNKDVIRPSAKDTHTVCPWKGTASYDDIVMPGSVISDAAWYYPEPKAKATNIKNHLAFYKNKVQVQDL